ncbi:class I SAM-dependent methyltransferase [Ensifer sp. 4252]|uniref:class I SAM-dependent methyltransferase n=1 Tax=Ensifer sp. 4252 TaxID=3373915 RepID=UPI003D245A64
MQAESRIGWAVEMVAPQPSDWLLEIGCGHGVAVTGVSEKLVDGRIVAIDRSATMIAAAKQRNVSYVAAGRAVLETVELAQADFGDARFDAVFAIRVGVFARGDPSRELAVLARVLKPEGRFFLFHDEPAGNVDDISGRIEARLADSRWSVESVRTRRIDGIDVVCVIARPGKFENGTGGPD